MKLVPLGQNVVIKPTPAASETAGGIVLPEAAREKPQEGRVLSVGDGQLLPNGEKVGHQVHEGDQVLYPKYVGTEVEVDGVELLIIRESEILAVVNGTKHHSH